MAVIECRRINALPIAAFVNLICLTRSAPTDLQARLFCLLLLELQLPMCCVCCGWHCVKAEYSNSNGNRNRNRNRSGSSRQKQKPKRSFTSCEICQVTAPRPSKLQQRAGGRQSPVPLSVPPIRLTQLCVP